MSQHGFPSASPYFQRKLILGRPHHASARHSAGISDKNVILIPCILHFFGIKKLCIRALKQRKYRHGKFLFQFLCIMHRTNADDIIKLIFFHGDHFRVTDIPHHIHAFLISAVRTVKMASAQNQDHIGVFLAIPVFFHINNGENTHSIQVPLQGHRISVIAPPYLFLSVRRRTFDDPHRAATGNPGDFRSALAPVIPTFKFLVNILSQIHKRLCILLQFLEDFSLTLIFLFQFPKFTVHIRAAYRKDTP